MRNLYIVGDCFGVYAKLDDVYTVADLINDSSLSSERNLDEFLSIKDVNNIILGQGISQRDRAALLCILKKHGKDNKILHKPTLMCGEKHIHKANIENSLITFPENIGNNTYTSDVFVSDKNELIQDHVTGNHIQGMIVVEAFRQLILATTEEYYSTEESKKTSFVWKQIKTDFQSYVFPIDMQITLAITEINQIKSSRFSYKGNFALKQRGRIVCIGYSEWETLDFNISKRQENLSAIRSVA